MPRHSASSFGHRLHAEFIEDRLDVCSFIDLLIPRLGELREAMPFTRDPLSTKMRSGCCADLCEPVLITRRFDLGIRPEYTI
jgi:hypothetical protein